MHKGEDKPNKNRPRQVRGVEETGGVLLEKMIRKEKIEKS
jgi:hypothetical protein